MTATRRQAREWAVQMLTAADLNPVDDAALFMASQWEQLGSLEEEFGGPVKAKGGLKAFAEERVAGVLGSLRELDKIIAAHLDNWDLCRLGTVERAVLRLGVWEMLHSDVPAPVVINEAIDLVNWFSGARSRTIVNAVLDKVAKTRKAQ
ncbi:MAG: transcription antitermination factor NusB [Kiritimatiellae bacterium]|nr:transcription antitermination factor NusB [Kiritimatiellia bacterium]